MPLALAGGQGVGGRFPQLIDDIILFTADIKKIGIVIAVSGIVLILVIVIVVVGGGALILLIIIIMIIPVFRGSVSGTVFDNSREGSYAIIVE